MAHKKTFEKKFIALGQFALVLITGGPIVNAEADVIRAPSQALPPISWSQLLKILLKKIRLPIYGKKASLGHLCSIAWPFRGMENPQVNVVQ